MAKTPPRLIASEGPNDPGAFHSVGIQSSPPRYRSDDEPHPCNKRSRRPSRYRAVRSKKRLWSETTRYRRQEKIKPSWCYVSQLHRAPLRPSPQDAVVRRGSIRSAVQRGHSASLRKPPSPLVQIRGTLGERHHEEESEEHRPARRIPEARSVVDELPRGAFCLSSRPALRPSPLAFFSFQSLVVPNLTKIFTRTRENMTLKSDGHGREALLSRDPFRVR